MNRTGRQILRIAALGAAIGLCGAVSGALAAPPGDLPYGAYDPGGDYRDDGDLVIEHLFLPWEDVYLPSLVDADAYARARNRALIVTLEPWTWTRSERNTAEALREGIRRGAYDANMKAVCDVLATLQSPVTLRWAHEMENSDGQFIWSGWDPEDYISAFRHMTDVCRASAPNVRIMWSPAGEEGLEAYYPGDDYVDLVGISVFGLQANDRFEVGRDRSYTEVMGPRYQRAAQFGKPVVVAELGMSGSADYVASWDAALRQPEGSYPNLVGVVYYDQKEVYAWPHGFGLPDWRLEFRVTD
ncbi:beta-mannanase [Cereibacter sphaeroides WS8N]|jgi:endoglucanase|uniref:glycoside hydrolase family 26 protein n=1 Tax=Cereibacter sphaeroides TaxID=1063 RepID=UPI00020DF326|nr:glycosyl hydrolase [Cereibacter sphaeroides]EGJ21607.1 beta-mannanase [Cereibacter sphaeroides WS8N]SNT16457.1 endoglucanase [[Luteovulum] sphaeroides subsp. megalophilum]